MKRRQFSPEFKIKIVLEMLREEKTISEIASEHEISPNQLRNWKKEFLENAVKVFSESRDARESKANEKELEQDRNDLLANYHQPVCSAQTYGELDHILWNMLWHWAKRRHPSKGKKWIKQRYWSSCGNRNWLFCDKGITLESFRLPIVRHRSLKLNMNPYLETDYFCTRKTQLSLARTKAKHRVSAC